jgi:hypothetical protein
VSSGGRECDAAGDFLAGWLTTGCCCLCARVLQAKAAKELEVKLAAAVDQATATTRQQCAEEQTKAVAAAVDDARKTLTQTLQVGP